MMEQGAVTPTMRAAHSSLRKRRRLVCGGAPGGAAAYVIGRARLEAVTSGNREWPLARKAGRSQGPPKGVSQTPWRHRKSGLPDLRIKHARSRVNPRSGALHSPRGETEKGKQAYPAPVKNTGDHACLLPSPQGGG